MTAGPGGRRVRRCSRSRSGRWPEQTGRSQLPPSPRRPAFRTGRTPWPQETRSPRCQRCTRNWVVVGQRIGANREQKATGIPCSATAGTAREWRLTVQLGSLLRRGHDDGCAARTLPAATFYISETPTAPPVSRVNNLAELLLATRHRRIEGVQCDGDHMETAN
jgi:hypothetical protein